MKQTLEEFAIETAEDCYEMPYDENFINMKLIKEAVEYGAKWHAKQSLWINVKERLPEYEGKVLVLYEYEGEMQIQELFYIGEKRMVFGSSEVLAWMPIPSFDEILEANRDVLERIKEKGD